MKKARQEKGLDLAPLPSPRRVAVPVLVRDGKTMAPGSMAAAAAAAGLAHTLGLPSCQKTQDDFSAALNPFTSNPFASSGYPFSASAYQAYGSLANPTAPSSAASSYMAGSLYSAQQQSAMATAAHLLKTQQALAASAQSRPWW